MAAVIQIDAAVVRPRTEKPSFMITPAPRKPMPVMMPCAIRVGSVLVGACATSSPYQTDWYSVTSISMLADTQTSTWVRKPAGRPW